MRDSTTPIAALATLALAVSVALWAATYRGLYADGALYFLHLLTSDGFFHVSPYRVGATFINQAPLLLTLHIGADSLRWLAVLHSLALAIVPATSYGAALWLARHERALFAASVTVMAAVFYPTSFLLVGEFHILYALFWLAWMMLLCGAADRAFGAAMLVLLGIALLRSYEVSLLLCGMLAPMAAWRAWNIRGGAARGLLYLAAILFVLGAGFGLQGMIHPRDAANTHDFAMALLSLPRNGALLVMLSLSMLAVLAAGASAQRRWRIGVLLFVLTLSFVVFRIIRAHGLGLGPAFAARAQVAPILAAVALLCLLPRSQRRLRPWQPWFLMLPIVAAFSIDAGDTYGWHRFISAMCDELAARAQGRTDSEFVRQELEVKYGWSWTYPTMSVLLRPADSTAMIANRTHQGWEPGDTVERGAALERFKRDGGLCGQ